MPFSLAIFSADWPIVSPVDGSAIAGVTGTRSRGRVRASAPSRVPTLFALLGLDQDLAEATRVEDGDIGQRFDAAGEDHVGMAQGDLVGRIGDRLGGRRAGAIERVRRHVWEGAAAGGSPRAPRSARGPTGPPGRRSTSSTSRPSSSLRTSSSRAAWRASAVAETSRKTVPLLANGVRRPPTMATRRPGRESCMSTYRCRGRSVTTDVVVLFTRDGHHARHGAPALGVDRLEDLAAVQDPQRGHQPTELARVQQVVSPKRAPSRARAGRSETTPSSAGRWARRDRESRVSVHGQDN